mmetsp:Transcript_47213/g.111330  ORF Transcript_47213/g.111330 Transcript_47213/m.111330 type:complete len:216 (+) Transcript_47213:587-1234(+)
MYPRSRRSGFVLPVVASCSTCLTSAWALSGFLRKSLTVAVRSCSWTSTSRSPNSSTKASRSSCAFSMRSAYWPTIQMRAALASGSSSESKFSHSTAITLSYWLGYLRKMSLMTTIDSCTTYATLVWMHSRRTVTQRSAAFSILRAHLPIARTALRTKSTSTSANAYSLSSSSTCSALRSLASITITSTFSIFTYVGSLYLQKKTLVSLARMVFHF